MFYGCTSLEKVVLGDNIEKIGNTAFFECTSLKDILWNSKLKTIDWNVFYGCTSLKEIVLPESLERMDDYVFSGCTNINKVSLGSKVVYIGTECFSGLPDLERMEVKAVVPPELGSYVFYNSNVLSCELVVPAESVDDYKAVEQWKDFMQIVPTSVQSVVVETAPIVSVKDGKLYVENISGICEVSVYSVNGRKLYSARTAAGAIEADLPSGVYVVCVNGKSTKVLVRK